MREGEVVIVEKNRHLGGKMNVMSEKGYHFDMGPTIITMPEVVSGIIRRSGRKVEDYLELIRLDPQWRCFYEDGTVLDLRDDPQQFAADLDRQFPEARPGRGYLEFLAYARRMYRLSEKVFFYKDIGEKFLESDGTLDKKIMPSDSMPSFPCTVRLKVSLTTSIGMRSYTC